MNTEVFSWQAECNKEYQQLTKGKKNETNIQHLSGLN